jgi:hypothetical protein
VILHGLPEYVWTYRGSVLSQDFMVEEAKQLSSLQVISCCLIRSYITDEQPCRTNEVSLLWNFLSDKRSSGQVFFLVKVKKISPDQVRGNLDSFTNINTVLTTTHGISNSETRPLGDRSLLYGELSRSQELLHRTERFLKSRQMRS